MLQAMPQVGYYPEYPSTASPQRLPFWITNLEDVSLMLRRIQQNIHSGIDPAAYFSEHIADSGDIFRVPFVSSPISANLRISGDIEMQVLGFSLGFEHDP